MIFPNIIKYFIDQARFKIKLKIKRTIYICFQLKIFEYKWILLCNDTLIIMNHIEIYKTW